MSSHVEHGAATAHAPQADDAYLPAAVAAAAPVLEA